MAIMNSKKMKKYGAMIVSSALLLGTLTACGSKDEGSNDSSSSGDTIKIGLNLELSGNVASYGSGIAAGAELAIKEINDAGGIDGKKIEAVKIDNKSDAAEATSAALKLATQEKVVAQIGSATSGNTVASVQVATQNKMPIISPSGTSETVTVNDDGSVNDYAFRTCFIDPFQGQVAANFASNDLKAKNVAIFSDSSSDYAKGLADAFKKQIEANGGKVVAEESYVAKDTDFKSTLTRLKSKNPDFIYVPGYYEEVGLIVKQARAAGIDAPMMGGDGWDSPKIVELGGGDALNNTFFTNHYSAEDPDEKIQKFVTAFKDANSDKSPDAFNALGYDSVYWLKDAIETAGSTKGEDIQKALAATKDLSLVTGTFSVDDKHNTIKSATVLEFKDGKQVFKTKVEPES
jgi:branched-chain amino acid transport system substrate-binding protein